MMVRQYLAYVIWFICISGTSIYCIQDAFAQEPQVCFDDTCVRVEIMRTDAQMKRGLSGRERLRDDQGMLFDFGRDGKFSFWMKDMKFNLDIIWIDTDSQVIDVKENLTPCSSDSCPSYTSQKNARYVLEVNAGFCRKRGIYSGRRISFRDH